MRLGAIALDHNNYVILWRVEWLLTPRQKINPGNLTFELREIWQGSA